MMPMYARAGYGGGLGGAGGMEGLATGDMMLMEGAPSDANQAQVGGTTSSEPAIRENFATTPLFLGSVPVENGTATIVWKTYVFFVYGNPPCRI
jgi:hypothetical protein